MKTVELEEREAVVPYSRYCTRTFLEGLKKTTKISIRKAVVSTELHIENPPNKSLER
jgi:hypothetical protein